MTFLSYPTALLLALLAVASITFYLIAPPPRSPRALLFVALVLTVIAVVVDLVVALR